MHSLSEIDFPPAVIKEEIKKKGFSVYPYISLKELSMTIQKDFLVLLDIVKYFFLIALGIGAFLGQTIGFFIVLTFGYLGIFSYLIVRVFWRTRAFIYLNNVIFTPKNLITGYQIYAYKNTARLNQTLSQNAELFDEYLGQKSSLTQKIKDKRDKILKQSTKDFGKLNDFFDRKNKDNSKFILYFFLLIAAYSLSLIVFYYIGILFVMGFFFCYAFFLKIYFTLFERRELYVKKESENIEKHLLTVNKIEKDMTQKIKSFEDGQIFDLEKYIKKYFGNFYRKIEIIFTKQKSLHGYIAKNFQANLIDFDQFEKYIWKQIKAPIHQVKKLLTQVGKQIREQINQTKTNINKTTDPYLLGPLEQKMLNLNQMNLTLKKQLEKLEAVEML